jgi:hypothetical protein
VKKCERDVEIFTGQNREAPNHGHNIRKRDRITTEVTEIGTLRRQRKKEAR